MGRANKNVDIKQDVGKLNRANNNTDVNFDMGRLGGINKNANTEYNVSGTNNTLDIDKANNTDK